MGSPTIKVDVENDSVFTNVNGELIRKIEAEGGVLTKTNIIIKYLLNCY